MCTPGAKPWLLCFLPLWHLNRAWRRSNMNNGSTIEELSMHTLHFCIHDAWFKSSWACTGTFVVIKPENPHFASHPGRELNPLGIYPQGLHSFPWRSYQRYNFVRRHSMCQLRLTLKKMTGWLATLDLRKPYTSCILSRWITSRDPPRCIPLSTNTQGSLVP